MHDAHAPTLCIRSWCMQAHLTTEQQQQLQAEVQEWQATARSSLEAGSGCSVEASALLPYLKVQLAGCLSKAWGQLAHSGTAQEQCTHGSGTCSAASALQSTVAHGGAPPLHTADVSTADVSTADVSPADASPADARPATTAGVSTGSLDEQARTIAAPSCMWLHSMRHTCQPCMHMAS
jgi:hypothetical protein